MAKAHVSVVVTGDATDAVRAMEQTERAVQDVETQTKKSGKGMSISWAAVGAAMLGVVRASSQLESATVAVNTVFGAQGDEMMAWAEGMSVYGLSTAQAAQAAAVLGAQLKNAGFSAEQMTVITQGLIETAAQLSTVMGVDTVTAVQAMGAALRGEYDSLEALGITLTADAVATEAMRLAQEGATFATEQQAKTVATLSLIQQGATNILGEAETQQVTLKAATEHLFAATKNLAAGIGEGFIPVLGTLVDSLAKATDGLAKQVEESAFLQDAYALLNGVIQGVAEILTPLLSEALSLVTGLLDLMWSIVEPILVPALHALEVVLNLIADALAIVIGWVNDAIAAFQRFIDIVLEAIDSLTFWNDSYTANAPPTAMMASANRYMMRFFPTQQAIPSTRGDVNITINAGVGSDPHAIAREIRRVLKLDAARMGRAA